MFIPLDFFTDIRPDLKPYVTPDGPILGTERHSNGLVTVRIDKDWTLNQAMIDEIYNHLAAGAKKYSIDPLPCRFVRAER